MKPKSEKNRRRDLTKWMHGNYTAVTIAAKKWWRAERQNVKRALLNEVHPAPNQHKHDAHYSWI